ncbi:TagK domain-containing protein [Caballeronia sp. LZ029]|uniref:TagK domain-containing protein n=1 Tax=Caballeronia sp. LZ029 TaxID=3038564 RepID=UPI002861F6F4|nr:TagK domain-containing protein [Caballeronia sp. LZ029]MDR5741912.1 TagK domain-containing protein [Caballeronia sp. LZ029]
MSMLKVPWRRRGTAAARKIVSEMRAPGNAHQRETDSTWIDLLSDADSQLKSDPVLGLIGGAADEAGLESIRAEMAAASDHQTNASAASNASKDLINSLQRQYWRALADPHDVLMGSWAWQENEPAPPPMIEAAEHGWQAPKASSQYESIEALLSGQHTLEDAFGQMTPGHDDLEVDAVPEVLRLFAPVEYHAAEARRSAALPPALNRREHHVLSVDSAFVAPAAADHEGPEEIA